MTRCSEQVRHQHELPIADLQYRGGAGEGGGLNAAQLNAN